MALLPEGTSRKEIWLLLQTVVLEFAQLGDENCQHFLNKVGGTDPVQGWINAMSKRRTATATESPIIR